MKMHYMIQRNYQPYIFAYDYVDVSFGQEWLRVVIFFIFDSPDYSHHVVSELLGCHYRVNLPVNLLERNPPLQYLL